MKKRLANKVDTHWRKVFSKFIAKNQKQKALSILDKMITDTDSLFNNTHEFKEDKRIALLLRIDLLRYWNRELEALAWLCLECEIRPENKLAQLLKDEFLHKFNFITNPNNQDEFTPIDFSEEGWLDIAGMRETKTLFLNDIIKPILNPKQYLKFKISTPNGVLLYGPPGCGKTFIARKLASIIDYYFMEIDAGELASIYVHGTQGKIKDLFDKAIEYAPTLLVFNEFDSLVPNRNDTSHHYKAEVNEFLTQLENINDKDVLVVATTNLKSNIDPAILRPGRIDRIIFIPPPDFESRKEAFKMFLKDRPQTNIDLIRLTEYTENYTFAEIKELANRAALIAANTNNKITTDSLVDLILENPPTLSEEDIKDMKE